MILRNQLTKIQNRKTRKPYLSIITVIILTGILMPTVSNAQRKNSLTFGAGLLTATTTINANSPTYYHSVTPSVGYFPTNNFAFGMRMDIGIKNNPEVPFSLNGYGRMYFGKVKHSIIKLFVEAGGGAAHNKVEDEFNTKDKLYHQEQTPATFKATAYVSPGINIYMGSVVALELAPEYRYIAGMPNLNRLGANIGLRIFLTKEQIVKTAPQEFHKLY